MTAPTRRTLMGATAALATLAIPATAQAAAGDDAELLAACAEFHAAKVAREAPGLTDEKGKALDDVWYEALERIEALRPRTPKGMQAKAGAAFAALMDDVHVFPAKTWQEQATAPQALAIVTLREISGRA